MNIFQENQMKAWNSKKKKRWVNTYTKQQFVIHGDVDFKGFFTILLYILNSYIYLSIEFLKFQQSWIFEVETLIYLRSKLSETFPV